MNSPPTFRLKLFGSPSLQRGDGASVTGRPVQRHRLALLALLGLAAGQRLSRDKLLAYLWPETGSERGRNLLKVATYVLREALGESALLSTGEDLRLNTEAIQSDVAEFEAALKEADHARAVALYTGPFLDGFFLPEASEFEQWTSRERERLAGLYGKSLEALADAAEGAGDFRGAVERWKARASHDPYDSRVALRLMQALEASGNRAGALQHYAIHQRLLQEEFGTGPAREVTAMAERLRTEPSASTPALAQRDLATEEPKVSPAAVRRPGKSRLGAAAALGAIALIVAAWSVWPRSPEPERSIVVLPFTNISSDQENEHFADGLTEEIITRLSAVPGLKVISRTSAMHFKGSGKPLPQIAEELNVAHVLEGTVRRSGGRVRISAQLVEARADERTWAENYDHELQDIFRVQREIAEDVVRALEVELGERGRTALARQGTADPEAYQLYRRARFLWSMRTTEGHEQAIEYYERAIERDSGYADAYAGLADTYLTAYQLKLSSRPEAEAYSRHKWAAERALALDDESADAHTSFAVSLWWQRNWPGAERELRRAIELNPGHATAHGWYSLLLAGMGRTEEAVRESRRAHELDPFAFIISLNYGDMCYVMRDYECTLEQYRGGLAIQPTWAPAYGGIALTYAQMGMQAEAFGAIRKALELNPLSSDALANLAYVQAVFGEREAAHEALRRAKRRPGEPFTVARAHAALGEADSAFAWLDKSRWQWPHRGVLGDPALDPLRSDPRFAQLTARVEREMGVR